MIVMRRSCLDFIFAKATVILRFGRLVCPCDVGLDQSPGSVLAGTLVGSNITPSWGTIEVELGDTSLGRLALGGA
jgi:hypothetical protein